MALGDTKTFDFVYTGLTLQIIAIDNGDGTTDFQIKCISGSADVNALWWGDGTNDGSSPTLSKSDSSLNMNGTGVDWDGYAKLSSAGLGPAGWDKATALTAGETYNANNVAVDWSNITTLGVRATSTSTSEGSIKGVDGSGIVQELPDIAISDAPAVTEGDTAHFTVTLSNTYAYDVKVYYQTQDGTATAGSDFTGATSYLIIPAGQTSATINVSTLNNGAYELTENFTVQITNAVADIPDALGPDLGLTVTDGSGAGTINDNDPPPVFSIDDVSVNEADGTITFTVTKTGATEVPASVDFAVNPGSAGSPDDYSGVLGGTLNFAANETTKTITLNITDDNVYELTENFTVDLSNAVNATISDNQGVGTITDNDPPPAFSINDVTRNESDGTITFTITKTGATDVVASVNYAISPNTAGTPGDYSANDALTGFVTFMPNETTKTVTLNITNDTTYEPTETFYADLSGANNATISDSQGVGTIIDDDPSGPTLPQTYSGADPYDHDTDTATPTGNTGTPNPDILVGDGGNNNIEGNNAGDTIYGGAGNDTLQGNNGSDTLYGQPGDDDIAGQTQADTVYGGSGDDIINGGQDNDLLYGGSGNDTISGDGQNDTIIGGYGADIINATANNDTIVYLSTLDTNDTINGFTSGADKLDLSAIAGVNAWAGHTPGDAVQVSANSISWYTNGSDVFVLVDNDGNTGTVDLMITLTGVTTINQSDFIF